MGELIKTVEKNQQFEEQEEKLCSVEKIKLLEDTSEILLWGETVSQALTRLRPQNKDQKKSKKVVATTNEANPFDKLTEKADLLMSQLGLNNVYNLHKEDLLDQLDLVKRQLVQWEYKWPTSETIYGPYSTDDMSNWMKGGYFIPDRDGLMVLVRQVIEKVPFTDFVSISEVGLEVL
eukprot:TRINITY_DN165_c0_g1_i7.p1 TRINITY_DN165_c0_g1~~TRINITY_DN165_c0_g1_i7.p1  ORF type:complete len:177 (+),score=43.84 TRINITY_DN165_c0_g1_i7:59-589(+)